MERFSKMPTKASEAVKFLNELTDSGKMANFIKHDSDIITSVMFVAYHKHLERTLTHKYNAIFAQEVVSETFLKLCEKIELFNPEKSKIATFLFNVAKNVATDLSRNKEFKKAQKTESMFTDKDSEMNDTEKSYLQVTTRETPSDVKMDLNIILEHYKSKLTPIELYIITKEAEGFKQEEIAELVTEISGKVMTHNNVRQIIWKITNRFGKKSKTVKRTEKKESELFMSSKELQAIEKTLF